MKMSVVEVISDVVFHQKGVKLCQESVVGIMYNVL